MKISENKIKLKKIMTNKKKFVFLTFFGKINIL